MFVLEEDGGGVRTLCAGRVKSVSGGEGPFPPSPQLLDALLYVLGRDSIQFQKLSQKCPQKCPENLSKNRS